MIAVQAMNRTAHEGSIPRCRAARKKRPTCWKPNHA